jgi:hypothetical protein
MEVGFKWQLFPGDEKRQWIPTTALITSIYAPTGGTSPYSSETVEPYLNLLYDWSLTKKLSLAGSIGYLESASRPSPTRCRDRITSSAITNPSSPSSRRASGRRSSMSGASSCTPTRRITAPTTSWTAA